MRPLLLLLAVAATASARVVCRDVDVRNNPTNLERLRNCTEVAGYLQIVLMERERPGAFDAYVFPKLTRVSGFVLFYKVHHLRSIGRMFPNLTVVQGISTISDYAFILFDMPDLEEIGTYNLKYIARGHVRISGCPKLCFVHTIAWNSIGSVTTLTDARTVINDKCPACPAHCKGHCWNTEKCQEIESLQCHKECLGCSAANDPTKCKTCKNFHLSNDMGEVKCVAMCPSDRYAHEHTASCFTEEQCRSYSERVSWFPVEGKCVDTCPRKHMLVTTTSGSTCQYCGDECVKPCKTDTTEEKNEVYESAIDSVEALKKLDRCTHIDGFLKINFAGIVEPAKEKEIIRQLKQYLGEVREISRGLIIGRTRFVKEIDFLPKLNIIRGINASQAIFIYENKNLQKLWDWEGFNLTISNGAISFHDNPLLCISEIEMLKNLTKTLFVRGEYTSSKRGVCNLVSMNIRIEEINDTSVNIIWDQPENENLSEVVAYTVYYKESGDGNVTELENDDLCSDQGWYSSLTTNTSLKISGLSPFTRYAYYIKKQQPRRDFQSQVDYFHTLASDPDVPERVKAKALSHDSIQLKWLPPLKRNGILSFYKLFVIAEFDSEEYIRQRNYCTHPRTRKGEYTDIEEEEDEEEEITTTEMSQLWKPSNKDTCDCLPVTETRIFAQDKFDQICDLDSQSKFGFDYCKEYIYNVAKDSEEYFQVKKRAFRDKVKNNASIGMNYQNLPFFEIKNISANETEYVIKTLNRFTMYFFYFSVCNERRDDGKELCSSIIQIYARTKKDLNADVVTKPDIKVEDKDSVVVLWNEPEYSNGFIVSYKIEYRRLDKEHVDPIIECFPEEKNSARRKRHILKKLLPGKYKLNIKAESLAGIGTASEPAFFEIDGPENKAAIIVPLVLSSVLIFLAVLIFYFWQKRKRRLDRRKLITSINPDYCPTYIEDEWEVERFEIELHNELGKGIFGSVFYGIWKSKNLPVAVKTCHETATVHEQMEFLIEASVMKTFNKAHHVVKLLGVVSKGEKPLVVMELMERGDLKKYLRKMRDSSQNITCNEIYRMAIEIADGMTYLAAKKFVHRDLAARNCMVGQDRTVKIGDFGMARDVYETDYYKKGTKGLLPVRWMAPESLADGVFTTDSDVWSYGIILWEIATLAEQPYQGLGNEQVLHFVTSKGRLDRPAECPDLLYEIMRACWSWKPIERPTFNDVVEKLESHVGQDFQLVSFYHSREGVESRLLARERAVNQPALVAEDMRDYYSTYNASDDEVSIHLENNSNSNRPSYLGTNQRFSPQF